MSKKWEIGALLVYVDDILVTGEDSELITQVIQDLHAQFSLKNLGFITYFLGFEAYRNSTGLYLTQSKYISDLLIKTHMDAAKPSSTPMCLKQKLSATDSVLFDQPTLF